MQKAVTITGISTLVLPAGFEMFSAQITGMFGVTDVGQIAIVVQALRIYAVSLPFIVGEVLTIFSLHPFLPGKAGVRDYGK